MTCIVGIRLPEQGAILLSEGRITDSDGRIWTNKQNKLLQFPDVTIAVCGYFTVLEDIKKAGARTYRDIRQFVLEHKEDYVPEDKNFGLICYDHVADRLVALGEDGSETNHNYWVAEGAGSPYASGALANMKKPVDFEGAIKNARRAVKIAIKMHSSCGGTLHWFRCQSR